MTEQSELWIILEEEERDRAWAKVYRGIYGLIPDVYDINKSHKCLVEEQPSDLIMRNILIECMGDDDFMYALDEYHSCFRYNPKSKETKENPTFIPGPHGGYNAYFPDYYPNGDFYYFVAKNFSWGYWGHPWERKLYVYGDCLKTRIRQAAKELDLTICMAPESIEPIMQKIRLLTENASENPSSDYPVSKVTTLIYDLKNMGFSSEKIDALVMSLWNEFKDRGLRHDFIETLYKNTRYI